MSDAVTNAEVEDVLSSIRRLVSEDRRPLNRSKIEASSADKLMLTPSLRVSNDAPLADAYKKPEQGTEFRLDDVPAEALQDAPQGDHSVFDLSDAPEEADVPSGDTGRADMADRDDNTDLSADISAASGPTVDTYHKPGILNLGASELVETPVESNISERLSAKIAALETAVGRISGGWDAEEPEEEDMVTPEPLAMAWEDHVDLDATGAPLPAGRDQRDDASHGDDRVIHGAAYQDEDAFDEDETAQQDAEPVKALGAEEYLDEEMLRDLVSEIVREELQGALGERITRNVRKLVRREIHRALTAQDLE